MGGPLKKLLYFIVGVAALFIVAAIAISLFFDPNDYRDKITEEVRRETGRELAIEGDLELSLFPWFAVNIGKTTVGNAPGFGDEPFLSFDEARLSIEVLPLIRGDGLVIGAVVLDSFQLNLAIAEDGRNNWQDIAEHAEGRDDAVTEVPGAAEGAAEQADDVTFSVASVEISDAAVRYVDAPAGESYSLTDFNLTTGRIAGDAPIDIASNFNFELQPANLAGDVRVEVVVEPTEGGIILGDAEITAVGIDISLTTFDEGPGFRVEVDTFSLKSLLTSLNIEPPVTADPDALGKVRFAGDVHFEEAGIAVSQVEFIVDDTTFTGSLSLQDAISIDLAADTIDLDRYMAPAGTADASTGDAVPVEIPSELIRTLNVRGDLAVASAELGGMRFDNVRLGLNAANGNLRMHPIAADFFGGKYAGDVRINVAGRVPTLSVNEKIDAVNLGALAKAVFEQDDVTGTINGAFRLGGSGEDLAAIQKNLGGSISMELIDGAWEGTDVWYELRRARALLRQETPPEPTLPARTQFSNVRINGPVADGVFRNDDVFAELPFMQISGRGTVDIAAAEADYRLTARILDKPELATAATPEELEDFTEAEIPLRITGPLADPKIAPDIEGLLRKEVEKKVEEEIKDRLLKKLFGDDD
jgi:AsmA protein